MLGFTHAKKIKIFGKRKFSMNPCNEGVFSWSKNLHKNLNKLKLASLLACNESPEVLL